MCIRDRPADRQGEVYHRYVLGVYELLERMETEFPHILFEGCSGGGGRFDAGMLYYHPQIWCSDNTDAIDRLEIQYGRSFGYPISAVGSHVSASPNHQTGRVTPFHTRGVVAMAGTFGYELDLSAITEEEKELVKKQVQQYIRLYDLINDGDYYRLTDPAACCLTAWEMAAPDGSRALLSIVSVSYTQLEVLVNNAGIAQQKLFTDLTEEDWRRMFAVDVDGVFRCCQCALPHLSLIHIFHLIASAKNCQPRRRGENNQTFHFALMQIRVLPPLPGTGGRAGCARVAAPGRPASDRA